MELLSSFPRWRPTQPALITCGGTTNASIEERRRNVSSLDSTAEADLAASVRPPSSPNSRAAAWEHRATHTPSQWPRRRRHSVWLLAGLADSRPLRTAAADRTLREEV